ncbi:hypothetical protein ASPVEDRAFT_580914 [Aspergillus versicolor CBS 583.65]|uniref:Uncharacterized protein n=1 Tax=Aspergillus versicolor CBS 583.65 TaxID=1036611 RepID=A0A1L9PGM7_ASPVE|nr:uncharacterized protein ASPVEDRAFT_580914 [Aspergillus versicolor CBS 583.65]OJJ00595.1 hypothetical protein ASPVEDRAFT_580914 [Aspergillus versicolor CBS 583.65]
MFKENRLDTVPTSKNKAVATTTNGIPGPKYSWVAFATDPASKPQKHWFGDVRYFPDPTLIPQQERADVRWMYRLRACLVSTCLLTATYCPVASIDGLDSVLSLCD